jgi:hypothetical protein
LEWRKEHQGDSLSALTSYQIASTSYRLGHEKGNPKFPNPRRGYQVGSSAHPKNGAQGGQSSDMISIDV